MTKELKELINFWGQVVDKKDNESKIHELDKKKLENIIDPDTDLIGRLRPNNLQNILEIENRSKAFHDQMIPVPYVGDLENAKIFYLTGNPAYEHADYFNYKNTSGLKRELNNNLIQKSLHNNYPFFFLNPKYCHTGGYRYWKSRLKKLVHNSSKLGMNKDDILRFLGKNLAVLELTGYPSKEMNKKAIKLLKSKELIINFVKNDLSKRKDVLILVARSTKFWSLQNTPKSETGSTIIHLFEKGQTRGGYISEKIIRDSGIIQFIKELKNKS